VAGLGFKISAVPFHQWTPDAYQGAPLPVTAFLSAAGKAAAFAFFLRFFAEALLPAAEEWSWLIAVVAAMTMITGNLVALRQTNLKRLMAYSSIGQVGYLLIGIVALDADTLTQSQDAATALILHLVGYVATNILMFTALIAFYNRTGKDDITDLRGLAERQPFLALIMAIALFSLAGMPLFAGFATKFIIFQVAFSNGYLWLGAIGVTASFVSLYYYLMIIKQMYLYQPEGEDTSRFRIPVPMMGALTVLTGSVFLLGLFPAPLFNAIDDSTGLLFAAPIVINADTSEAPNEAGTDEAEEVVAPEVEAEAEAPTESDQAKPQPSAQAEDDAVSEDPPGLAATTGDPTHGQQVFFQNGCNVCHGDTGQGGIGPTIAQTGFTVDQVLIQYRSPRGFMPAFPESVIPDSDVANVHAWLQTLPLPDVIVPGEGTPAQ